MANRYGRNLDQDEAPDDFGRPPAPGAPDTGNVPAPGAPGTPVPNRPGYVYNEQGQPVKPGDPVPGMPGQVYNSAGGMEPRGTTPTTPTTPGGTTPTTPTGTPEERFRAVMKGLPSTPTNLKAKEKELEAAGFKVLTNAAGVAGKIQFTDGGKTIIKDVIEKAGLGGQPDREAWVWYGDEGGADGAEFDDDFFDVNLPAPDAYTAPARPGYLQGEYKPPTWDEKFIAPDENTLYQDPGVKARLAAAQKGFERSAAAKGTLLSGGSQVALGRQQQEIAANEYGAAFGRAFDTYRQKYGQFQDQAAASFGARGLNENAYQSDVANALNQYGTRYRTYRDAVDDRFRIAELGKPGAP